MFRGRVVLITGIEVGAAEAQEAVRVPSVSGGLWQK